ncbi:transcription factor SRM1-like [Papaver somniferum]|uniref:transcription factor SRM1-like n=1 Tax=Papaver somniferum TaxID=3469 RepID=UPI000E6FF856|nr:transcription factor SRM1-like [Papaver somniferum]
MEGAARWTREQDKLFETGLVIYTEGTPDRFSRIAERVPGKSVSEVHQHYQLLVRDMLEIEAGHVELPNYLDDFVLSSTNQSGTTTSTSKAKERKIGIPWTAQEHRDFLLGLTERGRGDWRGISRDFVKSRTPGQVASHAQKYFIHINTKPNKKVRKRSSIHDTPL